MGLRDLFKRKRGQPGTAENASPVLSDREHDLAIRELAALDRLSILLDAFPATDEDRERIADAKMRLESLFLLVIAGEFNSGKSAFINALIGADIMPEGVTPTTALINLLTYGEKQSERMLADGSVERTYPAAFLEDITVVDTPGTNAIVREHEALTQHFVPNADIVFFVTSADRPFTESERAFMEDIREWGKKIVVIVNKIDLLRADADVREVTTFVEDNIARLLGFEPVVFPVSAMQAQQANELSVRNPQEGNRLWTESRFGALEEYIYSILDEQGRIQLKLLSPLGTAEYLGNRYLEITNSRLTVLAEDLETIHSIERQLALYQEDMRKQLDFHLGRIENIISRMTTRGDDYFEETIRIGRIFDLIKSDRIRAEFEEQVVGNAEAEIDDAIQELIDWMVEQDLRTWEAINGYLDRRRLQNYEGQMVGEVSSQFRYDRKALLDSVTRRAREEVDRYDADRAGYELSQSVRNAVAQVAVAEAGAIGLGALVVAAASTVAVDVTGIFAASVLAGIGLVILPRKRKQARQEFRARSENLERSLIAVMTEQFDIELQRSVQRIESALAPYTRFVRDQHGVLTVTKSDLEEVMAELRSLRHQITGETQKTPALTQGE
ncbi:MAG: dynamin family protein [Thermomicrobiales bacterium]|nr:dynamin family protein [Thermomicrobiales bacterium]